MTFYPRAPITEAVIEFRFAEQIKFTDAERAARKFGAQYPVVENEEQKEVTFEFTTGVSKSNVSWSGRKLSSSDRADVTMIRTTAFLASRLAPYLGWDQFVGRARADWERVKSVIGYRKIVRVGVRYINRIDIPGALKKEIVPTDYVTLGITMPDLDWGPITEYFMQVNRRAKDNACGISINSGVVPSPLVGYRSILVDIDVSTEEVPADEDGLWGLVENIRNKKNDTFEAIITDAARDLFK